MNVLYQLLRRILFRLEAESAHEFASNQIEHLQQIPAALRVIAIPLLQHASDVDERVLSPLARVEAVLSSP